MNAPELSASALVGRRRLQPALDEQRLDVRVAAAEGAVHLTDRLAAAPFHVAFIIPEPIGAIALQAIATVCAMLFQATAETLQTVAADPGHLGTQVGFFAVLHTWGQTLIHHPHQHCVVPGGGLSPDGTRWIACRPGFFLRPCPLTSLSPSVSGTARGGVHGRHPDPDRLAARPGATRQPGRATSRRCGAWRGGSTPNGPSPAPSKSSSTWADTGTASPSRTIMRPLQHSKRAILPFFQDARRPVFNDLRRHFFTGK